MDVGKSGKRVCSPGLLVPGWIRADRGCVVFLGSYDFDGDIQELLSAYERLVAGFPQDAFDLHVCVVREGGITVYDTCPSRAVFADFSSSRGFRDAMAKAGLPAPKIQLLGDVHTVRARTADA